MNIDFAIHRNGEWIMLMLGESIFSLLIVEVPADSNDYYTTFFCGVGPVTCTPPSPSTKTSTSLRTPNSGR